MPAQVHPSRAKNVPTPSSNSSSKPKRKRPRLPSPSADADATTRTTGALRTAIRNIDRLLKREGLPADVRVEKEREVQSYRLDLEERERSLGRGQQGKSRERSRMVKRYHGVRFFERQKATRRFKKLKTELKTMDEDDPAREKQVVRVHEAEVDLNYTMYSPLDEKYVSIFPGGDYDEKSNHGVEKRRDKKPAWWFVVEKGMEEGKLEEIREGTWPAKDEKDEAKEVEEPDVEIKSAQKKAPRRSARRSSIMKGKVDEQSIGGRTPAKGNRQQRRESLRGNKIDEDESDGGFFEE